MIEFQTTSYAIEISQKTTAAPTPHDVDAPDETSQKERAREDAPGRC